MVPLMRTRPREQSPCLRCACLRRGSSLNCSLSMPAPVLYLPLIFFVLRTYEGGQMTLPAGG